MELIQATDRVWYSPFEKERDRPILGYIKGDNWSLAVDAGHSKAHTEQFYSALEAAGLPLPKLTVLTHSHWDHSFGMHATSGLCIANQLTAAYLRGYKERTEREGTGWFFGLDECIRNEYADCQPVIVTLPDIVFSGEMSLDPGNCPIRLLQTEAPHSDDSTLVYAENEKVLFLGDSCSGRFPTWVRDRVLCSRLAETVSRLDAKLCLDSHWTPQTKQEILYDLRSFKEGT